MHRHPHHWHGLDLYYRPQPHLKVIWVVLMAEDVHKEPSSWLNPCADPPEQLLVVLHVLKHLDRHNTVIHARSLEKQGAGREHGTLMGIARGR